MEQVTQPVDAVHGLDPESSAANLDLSGGALCLDFTNTVSARGFYHESDALDDYADLLAWSVHVGTLSAEAAEPLVRRAMERPSEAAAVLGRAKRFRETIYAILYAHAQGRMPDVGAMSCFNDELGPALLHLRVQPDADGFVWQWEERDAALDRPLWPIARSAADLLTGDELARVHQCAGDTCGWLFVDRSKNHSRRWCNMKECGNVAKVRRYRTRRKQAD